MARSWYYTRSRSSLNPSFRLNCRVSRYRDRQGVPEGCGRCGIGLGLTNKVKTIVTPTIIPRSEHIISRSNISENAVKVLYRLKQAGYQAHLVGGGVRDLLLGREPKDFDVATDARPEDVRTIFRNCRLIGRRFRLAHVHFGREIIEVATFRGADSDGEEGKRKIENGMILRDNLYGSIEEDAKRRDFTVNALYYNIADFSVVDYARGMQDLKAGTLRLLGDPEERYREDPVRMLRAVRFAAKLGFSIDPACEAPFSTLGHLLADVPAARLFEEVLKLFLGGSALQTFEKLRHYGLFGRLFPATEASLTREEQDFPIIFVSRGMENTDTRVREEKSVTPAFFFQSSSGSRCANWPLSYRRTARLHCRPCSWRGTGCCPSNLGVVAIPRRFSTPMREIWNLQHRFEYRVGNRPHRLLAHPRFRAAYDFMLLRSESGEADPQLVAWWTNSRRSTVSSATGLTKPPKGRGRGRRRKPKRADR